MYCDIIDLNILKKYITASKINDLDLSIYHNLISNNRYNN